MSAIAPKTSQPASGGRQQEYKNGVQQTPPSPSNAASSRPNPPPPPPPPPPPHTSEELKHNTYRFGFLLPFDSAQVLQLFWKVHLQQICPARSQLA